MVALDTNVLVRLITRDDASQTEAAERYLWNGGWISHLVLAEALWVLDSVYELDPKRIAMAVEMLLNHSELVLQDPEVISAALVQFRAKPSLRFSDCLVLEIARKAGHIPLGTFDRALGRREGAQLIPLRGAPRPH